MTSSWRVGVMVVALWAIAGCSEGVPGGGSDSGVDRMDTGTVRPDGSTPRDDASAPGDDASAPGDDASTPGDDASAPGDDASTPGDDASTPADDASTPADDGGLVGRDAGQPDAGCPPPVCPPPPPGCSYVGATACACGTLSCPDPSCSRCTRMEYCMTADGTCSGAGTCATRPDACSDLYDPVCGCDGATYSNACYAARMGQSVAFDGECPDPPSDCRTTGCPSTETCQECRGAGGAVYICLPRGVAC